jgi:hypothetical protein
MSRRLKIGLAVFAAALIGLTLASAQAGTAAVVADVYSVKFSCGEFGKQIQPNIDAKIEGPYKPGNYQTAINVHNPQIDTVVNFQKKAILLYSGKRPIKERAFEQPTKPGQLVTAALPPDFGMLIDCQDIRAVLLPGVAPAPTFIEGWVVLIVRVAAGAPAPPRLDVTAAYTSHGYQCASSSVCTPVTREGFSQNVVTIEPTAVSG